MTRVRRGLAWFLLPWVLLSLYWGLTQLEEHLKVGWWQAHGPVSFELLVPWGYHTKPLEVGADSSVLGYELLWQSTDGAFWLSEVVGTERAQAEALLRQPTPTVRMVMVRPPDDSYIVLGADEGVLAFYLRYYGPMLGALALGALGVGFFIAVMTPKRARAA